MAGREIQEGEQVLRGMLEDRGLDATNLAIEDAWPVFKEFATVPFDTASDGILYQIGTFSFAGADEFYLDFVRQFEVTEDGEHDHYEQLHCEFKFADGPETRGFGNFNQWWFASDDPSTLPPFVFASWPEFVSLVESRREFVALRERQANSVEIWQEEV